MATTQSRLMAALADMSNEVALSKQAAAAGLNKQAGPTPSDPGGYAGASSHPTTSIDNNAQAAPKDGPRSSENTSDVKDAVGAASIENATAPSPTETQQDKVQYNQGLSQSMTGEDPSVEDDYKANKEDPGTSHPAAVDDGVKYGSVKEAAVAANSLANSILADIAMGHAAQVTGAMNKQAGAAPAAPAATPAADVALTAGYELAGQVKEAGDAATEDLLESVFRSALEDGERVIGYLKAAGVESEEDGAESSESDSGEGGGGEGGESAAGGAGPEPIADAGGGAPPMDPMAGGGGADPMAGGADPMAGGAGGGEGDALQELVAALQELGITPEMLMEASQGAAGGGDPAAMGGAPPMDPMAGGGAPPMDPAAGAMGAGGGLPPELAKAANLRKQAASRLGQLADVARNHMLSGKYEIKAAETKQARAMRDNYKQHVRELLGAIS